MLEIKELGNPMEDAELEGTQTTSVLTWDCVPMLGPIWPALSHSPRN